MNENIQLRRAREGDGAALCEIQVSAICVLGRSHYTPAELEAWSGYRDGSLTPDRLEAGIAGCFGVVAETDSRIVAFGTLGDDGEVRAIYVRPAYARQGIGSAVLSALLAEARRRGLRRVRAKASLSGEAFYVSAGFIPEERCRHRFRSGAEIDCVWLAKDLTADDAPERISDDPQTDAAGR